MAVARVAYAENFGTAVAAGGTITLASLAVSGSDRGLLVTVVARPTITDGQDTIDTVVFNGSESLTEIAGDVDVASSGVRLKTFWLTAPSATTADVVVTTKDGSCHLCAFAQALSGVDQTTPYTLATTTKASSTTPNVTVSSATGKLVLASIGHRGSDATFTADGDTTEIDRVQSSTGAAHVRAILTEIAGASSVSPSGVLSVSKSWIATGLSIHPPAYTLTADAGAYTLTGQSAGLRAARMLAGAAGAYTLAGQSATLTYSGSGGSTYTLAADAGTYSLTGQVAGLRAARRLVAGTGVYSLSGASAGLARGLRLVAAAGSYTLAGQSAALRVARRLAAAAGGYTLTGVAATLTYTGALSSLGQYLIELLGLDRWLVRDQTVSRWLVSDQTVTRYLISETTMTTTTTASAYLWLTEDQEAEFAFHRKQATTGVIESAAGLTGMTVHVSATAGGAVIGALTFALAERGSTGIYYAVMDTATLVAGLSTASYPDGAAVYLVVSKAGDIASRSFRKIVKRQRVGDG